MKKLFKLLSQSKLLLKAEQYNPHGNLVAKQNSCAFDDEFRATELRYTTPLIEIKAVRVFRLICA